jgi:Calx-beta domain
LQIALKSRRTGDTAKKWLQSEATTPMNFTAALFAASGLPVTFNAATAAGSAIAPGDYTALSSAVTIPAGSLAATIPVLIVDDSTLQGTKNFALNLSGASNAGNESFFVNLSAPSNATIAASWLYGQR